MTSSRSTFYIVTTFCVLTFGIQVSAASGQFIDSPTISHECQLLPLAATVRVRTNQGTGCGCIIAQEGKYGFVLTVAHVAPFPAPEWVYIERFYVDGWPNIVASAYAEVIYSNSITDIAILRFETPDVQLPILKVASRMPELPFEGFSVGCANGNPPELTWRRIESQELSTTHQSRLTTTSPETIGGQSGGPLFNSRGEVIGTCYGHRGETGLWTSLTAIHEALDAVGLRRSYTSPPLPRLVAVGAILVKLIIGGLSIFIVSFR